MRRKRSVNIVLHNPEGVSELINGPAPSQLKFKEYNSSSRTGKLTLTVSGSRTNAVSINSVTIGWRIGGSKWDLASLKALPPTQTSIQGYSWKLTRDYTGVPLGAICHLGVLVNWNPVQAGDPEWQNFSLIPTN